MEQILATKLVWCGKVFAIRRTFENDNVYILQGKGLRGEVINEKIFSNFEALSEAFNNTKNRY